jgi:thymidylate kinase
MLVAIEGNTGTGKTTVYDALRDIGYFGIKEYSFYVMENPEARFPPFPPISLESVVTSHDTWQKIEELKNKDLQASQATSTVMDRSFLSIFAFEYAKKMEGYLYDFKMLTEIYRKLLEENRLTIPDSVVHLTANPEMITLNRNGQVNPFLYKEETISHIDEFISKYAKMIYGDSYITIRNDFSGLAKHIQHVTNAVKDLPDKAVDKNALIATFSILEKL